MLFMMNRILFSFLLFPFYLVAQTNNLTGSPYSFFGLGVSTNSNIGKNSALGRGGYALSSNFLINNLNPAALATLGEKSFLFDFGFLTEFSTVANRSTEETRVAGNFSNLAIASSITPKSAFGLSVVPYSDVGYSLIGIDSNVEGSSDSFVSNVFGTGSLNDLRLSYGIGLTDELRAGAYISYLFGAISERESVTALSGFVNESTLTISEENKYNGFRFGLGLQYSFLPDLTLGWNLSLPTTLSGTRDRLVEKTLDFIPTPVENETDLDIEGFDLPLEVGTGILFSPINKIHINLDYTLKLWNATDQRDNIGEFVNQYIYGIGVEYLKADRSFNYLDRIRIRAGFNYDSGYLNINGNVIDAYSITAGLGIPLGARAQSMLNIGFSSSSRGSTEGILVEERLNTININLSLKDIWFRKRKIN